MRTRLILNNLQYVFCSPISRPILILFTFCKCFSQISPNPTTPYGLLCSLERNLRWWQTDWDQLVTFVFVLRLIVLALFVLRFGNFDRSKSRFRRLEGPSRSAFRTIKLGKIPNTNYARTINRNTNQKLRAGPSPFVIMTAHTDAADWAYCMNASPASYWTTSSQPVKQRVVQEGRVGGQRDQRDGLEPGKSLEELDLLTSCETTADTKALDGPACIPTRCEMAEGVRCSSVAHHTGFRV